MALSYLLRSVDIERRKTRNSAALWLSVGGAGFLPLVFVLIYWFKPAAGFPPPQAPADYNGWTLWLGRAWAVASGVFLPFYVVLINALVVNIEHRNSTWKYVFTQPMPRWAVWLGKLLVIQALVVLCFLLFDGFLLVGGYGMGLVNEKFALHNHAPDWKFFGKLTLKMYVATLGMAGLHYWLANRVKNLVLPIGLALAGLIVTGLMLTWEYVHFFPYAYPSLSLRSLATEKDGPLLVRHEWISLGYFAVLTALGYLDLLRRRIA